MPQRVEEEYAQPLREAIAVCEDLWADPAGVDIGLLPLLAQLYDWTACYRVNFDFPNMEQ